MGELARLEVGPERGASAVTIAAMRAIKFMRCRQDRVACGRPRCRKEMALALFVCAETPSRPHPLRAQPTPYIR
jgi:hypothetical protein